MRTWLLALAIALLVAAPARAGVEQGVPYAPGLRLDAYLPARGAGHPAIVFVHGGGFFFGDRRSFAPGEAPVAPTFSRLAAQGFAVFSIDYRAGHYPRGARDVRRAVAFVRSHARRFRVDPGRVGLLGASAGGNLVALAATDGVPVRAAVSWSGPMDLLTFSAARAFVPLYVGCSLAACPGRYAAASPARRVRRGDPPIMLVNSTGELVPLSQAREMAARLAAAHVPHRLLVVPGSRHAGDYADVALGPTIRFLRLHLS